MAQTSKMRGLMGRTSGAVRLATMALVTWGALAFGGGQAQAADTWSPACTPDILQVFPDRIVTRCMQTGVWYQMNYAGHTDAYVDRMIHAIEAASLSGKTVQFIDVGPNGSIRFFSGLAFNRF